MDIYGTLRGYDNTCDRDDTYVCIIFNIPGRVYIHGQTTERTMSTHAERQSPGVREETIIVEGSVEVAEHPSLVVNSEYRVRRGRHSDV